MPVIPVEHGHPVDKERTSSPLPTQILDPSSFGVSTVTRKLVFMRAPTRSTPMGVLCSFFAENGTASPSSGLNGKEEYGDLQRCQIPSCLPSLVGSDSCLVASLTMMLSLLSFG